MGVSVHTQGRSPRKWEGLCPDAVLEQVKGGGGVSEKGNDCAGADKGPQPGNRPPSERGQARAACEGHPPLVCRGRNH